MTGSSRICSACQTSNPPQAAFCFGCGKPLEQSTKPELLRQRYRLLHELGSGGFGAVYQAEDTQLGGRLLAVKEMKAQTGLNVQEQSEITEAFKKEALLLAELMHPSLPRIYDHFGEDGNWYLVMDYIEGETLDTYQEKQPGGYLPLAEALAVALQLSNVLEYLHTRQPAIIFRDLKPLNIMRTASGHIYLIDFGIARHFKPGQIKDTVAFGSPGYAAPEQYGKTQTTPRSDIYSLGATLHHLLTGADPSLNPFRFSPLLLPAGQRTPQALAQLVARMVDMDEFKRPFNMHSVKAELQDIATRVASGSFATVKAITAPTPASTPSPTPTPVPAEPSLAQGALRCKHNNEYDGIQTLVWSPDNTRLASAGRNPLIDIWNAQDGQTVQRYQHNQGNIRMMRWSPDGRYLASAGDDRTIQIREVHSRQVIHSYREHTHIVTGLAWSPDSRRIASSSIDKSVRVWDIQTGYTYVTYTHHRDAVYRAAWSPDGSSIATGGYDNTVRVWEAMSGTDLLIYRGHSNLIFALAWSPDGQLLASGSYDASIQIWNATNGLTISSYSESGAVQSLDWSPDSQSLVSCSRGAVNIWDAATGNILFTYHGHETPPALQMVNAVTLDPLSDQREPVSGQLYRYVGFTAPELSVVAWSPDGQWIASGAPRKTIHVWSAG